MKPAELRIGNIIDVGVLKAHKIKSITQDGIDVYEGEFGMWHLAKWDEVQPIPLTEEWLNKFGLEFQLQKDGLKEWYYIQKGKFSMNNAKGYWSHSPIFLDNTYPIESIHQLQNLYYALTGEELEVLS